MQSLPAQVGGRRYRAFRIVLYDTLTPLSPEASAAAPPWGLRTLHYVYNTGVFLRYRLSRQFFWLSIIFGEISFFVVIITFLLLIAGCVSNCNVQIYRSGISSIYSI